MSLYAWYIPFVQSKLWVFVGVVLYVLVLIRTVVADSPTTPKLWVTGIRTLALSSVCCQGYNIRGDAQDSVG